jgi:transposase
MTDSSSWGLICTGGAGEVLERVRIDNDPVALARAYRLRVASLLDLIDAYDYEVEFFRRLIAEELDDDPGYHAIQAIPRVGPTLAAIFVAEIGDVTRFASPAKLCSWAGLTPKHRESDATVRRGHITKQGS